MYIIPDKKGVSSKYYRVITVLVSYQLSHWNKSRSLDFEEQLIYNYSNIPVSILHKSIVGRYRPVRVADGPITARCRFIKNASWNVQEASTTSQ